MINQSAARFTVLFFLRVIAYIAKITELLS